MLDHTQKKSPKSTPLLHRNEESKEKSAICTELIGASAVMSIVKSEMPAHHRSQDHEINKCLVMSPWDQSVTLQYTAVTAADLAFAHFMSQAYWSSSACLLQPAANAARSALLHSTLYCSG